MFLRITINHAVLICTFKFICVHQEKMYRFSVINRHTNQSFSFGINFCNRTLCISSVLARINWFFALILHDTSSNYTKTCPRHDHHYDTVLMVPFILKKTRLVVKIIHPVVVILLIELIKYHQYLIMKIHNTIYFFNAG